MAESSSPEVEIIIEENGDVRLEVFGVVGPECETLTAGLLDERDIVKRAKKPEFGQHRTAARKVAR